MHLTKKITSSYRADIDGLRAVAVLLVVAFHVAPTRLPSGFIGVDIFFVISGYLITGIIISDFSNGRFSFTSFYVRRIRRICPALVIVLGSCLFAGWWILLPSEYANLGKHIAGASGFLSNFLLWSETGYFDLDSELKPLLHLWSLGIEEQFYLIWPAILSLVLLKSKKPATIITLLSIGSFALALTIGKSSPDAAFYNPITRFWEIWVGAILALYSTSQAGEKSLWISKNAEILSLLGIFLISVGIIFTNHYYSFPGVMTIIPIAGTVLIIAANSESTLVYKLLSIKPAVMIGLISYPLYLWHWPLLSFTKIIEKHPTPTIRISLVIISFLLAWLTFRYVEIPIRKKANKTVALMLLFSLVALGGTGLAISITPALQQTRLTGYVNEEAIKAIDDWAYPSGLISRFDLKQGSSPVQYNANSSKNPKILLVGDSHMEQYSPRIVHLTKEGRVKPSLFMTCGGCPPTGMPIIEDIKLLLSKIDSVEKIIMAGAWMGYLNQNSDQKYESLTSAIEKLSERVDVIIVLDSPQDYLFDPRNQLTTENRSKLTFQFSDFDITDNISKQKTFPVGKRQLQFNKEMAEVVSAHNAFAVDPMGTICPKNICSAVDKSGKYIYKDTNHLRPFFVEENIEFLDQFILKKD